MGYITPRLAAQPTGTAGVVEATLTVPTAVDLLLERAFISTNSTTPTSLTIYAGDVDPSNRRSYTSEGDLDELEADPPIWFPAGGTVRFRWEGGTAPAGSTLQATAQVQGRTIPAGS